MKKIDKLMNALYMISIAVFLIGAIFKIQHYPYGRLIYTIGIIAYIVISSLEISRLRKIIAKSKKDDIKVD
jgi:bacteriorhodopsin